MTEWGFSGLCSHFLGPFYTKPQLDLLGVIGQSRRIYLCILSSTVGVADCEAGLINPATNGDGSKGNTILFWHIHRAWCPSTPHMSSDVNSALEGGRFIVNCSTVTDNAGMQPA